MKLFLYVMDSSADAAQANWGAECEPVPENPSLFVTELEGLEPDASASASEGDLSRALVEAGASKVEKLSAQQFGVRLGDEALEVTVRKPGLVLSSRDGVLAGAPLGEHPATADVKRAAEQLVRTFRAARANLARTRA